MSPVIHDGWGERCAMKRWMALDIGKNGLGWRSATLGTIAQGWRSLLGRVTKRRTAGAWWIIPGVRLYRAGDRPPAPYERAGRCRGGKIREFGVLLGKEAGVTPVFWDERLTTVQAERSLLQMNLSRRRRRQVIDQVAAAILLESFLRSHNPPER